MVQRKTHHSFLCPIRALLLRFLALYCLRGEISLKTSDLEKKRISEKKILEKMISLYCRRQHGYDGLCPHCEDLLAYAWDRVDNCPLMETKTFCSNCPVRCYSPQRGEEIRQVMRYAAPRLLLRHPIMVIRHGLGSLGGKRKLKSGRKDI